MGDVRRRGGAVVDDALAWLQKPSTSPFFVWIHLYDPHLPYNPLPLFRERYPNEPYLAEVAYSDAQLARVGAFLESAGLADRTMIIFAGDHGEGLGDHGETDHGLLVYQTTVRVPFIMMHPSLQSRGIRRPEVVSLVDLLPTLADATGIRLPGDVQGRASGPCLGGGHVSRAACLHRDLLSAFALRVESAHLAGRAPPAVHRLARARALRPRGGPRAEEEPTGSQAPAPRRDEAAARRA